MQLHMLPSVFRRSWDMSSATVTAAQAVTAYVGWHVGWSQAVRFRRILTCTSISSNLCCSQPDRVCFAWLAWKLAGEMDVSLESEKCAAYYCQSSLRLLSWKIFKRLKTTKTTAYINDDANVAAKMTNKYIQNGSRSLSFLSMDNGCFAHVYIDFFSLK